MTTVDTIDDLAAAVAGEVLRPTDPGYAAHVVGFNLAVIHSPDVVVAATSRDDVVAAIRWAARRGVPIGVQATGHGESAPIDRGLLIDTSRMDGVRVDPDSRTAVVEAGAKWRAVIDAAAPHGLAPLNGSASDVGVAGYTVGGGLPVLGRTFGFAADHVVSAEVVTADGVVRLVDPDHEPELFWALRGGKSTAGIVTSLRFELMAVPSLYGGGIFFSGEHASELLEAYTSWTGGLPDEMNAALAFLRLPPLPEVPEPMRGRFVLHLRVAFVGEPADGDRLLAPMRAAAPVLLDTVQTMPYADVDRIYQDPDHPLPAQQSCSVIERWTADLRDLLLAHLGPASGSPLLMVELRGLGGALARTPRWPDAVDVRDADYVLISVGILDGPQAAAVPAAAAELHTALARQGHRRTMVNLHGRVGAGADRARAWAPDTYRRLQRIKATYDPADLLRFGHAVASDHGGATDGFPS